MLWWIITSLTLIPSGIDFIKDDGWDSIGFDECGFEGEHDSRRFAAGKSDASFSGDGLVFVREAFLDVIIDVCEVGGFLNFLLVCFLIREGDVIRNGVAEKEIVLWGVGDILPLTLTPSTPRRSQRRITESSSFLYIRG